MRALRAARLRFDGLWLLTAKLAVIGVAAALLLAHPRVALGATGFGGLLPLWAALVWVGTALALCVLGIVALGLRRLEWASTALLVLAILIAVNAAVSIGVNGPGSVWAVGGYTVCAIAFFDRSRALHEYGNFKLRLSDMRGDH